MDLGSIAGFDWDQGNEDKNLFKHGLTKSEIESAFKRGGAVSKDLGHSGTEERLIAILRLEHGRHLFVSFTLRQMESGRHIRVISARRMHLKEEKKYEKENPKT